MLFLKLEHVRALGDDGTDVLCVANDAAVKAADLWSYPSFAGDDVHLQSATGKTIAKVTSLQPLEDGSAVMRLRVHDETAKVYCAQGDLTGAFIDRDGLISLVDRPLPPGASFLYRAADTGELRKCFTASRPGATVERYEYRSSHFGPVRKATSAQDRNGLTRQQNSLLYRLMKLNDGRTVTAVVTNRNTRFI